MGKRFIYASSSSVYGIKSEENVSENASLKPLTDYSKYKVLCEEQLLKFVQMIFVAQALDRLLSVAIQTDKD